MDLLKHLAGIFKPEIRSSGQRLFAQGKIYLSSTSDTQIHASAKGQPPLRVRLASNGISADSISTHCTCPIGKKGRLCKHIWATLLVTAEQAPDFLNAKQSIEKLELFRVESSKSQDTYRALAKERARDLRKIHYLKQKIRIKMAKLERDTKKSQFLPKELPPDVEAACRYFSERGFPLPDGPSEDVLKEAKRKLSRVFHPDRGGLHDEIVELNENFERLMAHLRG